MTEKLPRFIAKPVDYLNWLRIKNNHESVYFYTFHKCASRLFSGYILKNIEGLRRMDYDNRIFNGKKVNVTFEKYGFVYGPIRLSVHPLSESYRRLIQPTCQPEFVKDKIALFMIRDPRDILVSIYYSFGFTHGFSPVPELRKLQEEERDLIQSGTIDDYALRSAPQIAENFHQLGRLLDACPRGVLLRYEDMIDNWDLFSKRLTQFISLSPEVLVEIYQQSRPREKEDKSAHHRSGKVGGFHEKFKPETVESLNQIFKSVFERFGYQP